MSSARCSLGELQAKSEGIVGCQWPPLLRKSTLPVLFSLPSGLLFSDCFLRLRPPANNNIYPQGPSLYSTGGTFSSLLHSNRKKYQTAYFVTLMAICLFNNINKKLSVGSLANFSLNILYTPH